MASGIDKLSSTATINSVFRTKLFVIGQKFQITSIRIPLGKAVASNMEIIVKIYIDEESTTQTLATVNSTNFANSDRKIVYKEPELDNAIGENNFFLEFNHGLTVTLPQLLPIKITLETFDDE